MRVSPFFLFALTHAAVWGSPSSSEGISSSIDLTSLFNNKAVSASPGGANFDGDGGSFPLSQLPAGGETLTYRGINVSNPYSFLGFRLKGRLFCSSYYHRGDRLLTIML